MSESESVPHLARIRCRHCGRRIHADARVCPNCGRDPRSFPMPHVGITTVLLIALGTALAILLWYNARLILLAFQKEPTLVAAPPSATLTWTPRLRVVVATETPNPLPTETQPPTSEPSPSFTPIPSFTATATRTVTRPRPTSTTTPTAAPALVSPPIAFVPQDGEKLYGARRQIVLGWVVPDILPGNSWYRVRVEFHTRDNAPFAWCAFTQQGQLQFPFDYYELSSPYDRSFRWNVQLTQPALAGPRDSGCELPFAPASPPSATRTFFWY